MTPPEVAAEFVARINAHDLDGLCDMVTEDHIFIDALDNRLTGREAIRVAWGQYFAMVPDYWIRLDTVLDSDCVIALFGRTGGTYSPEGSAGLSGRWEIPAAWQAEIRDTRVAMWRLYADNDPMRRLMAGAQP